MTGGLSFVAIVCAAIAIHRSFTRRAKTHLPEVYHPDSSSYGTDGVAVTRTRTWTTATRMNTGHRTSMVEGFGVSAGDHYRREGLSPQMVSPSTVGHPIPMYKPPFHMQGRTEYPHPTQQPYRNFSLPRAASSFVSSTNITLSGTWEDPSVGHGVPTFDKKQSEIGDILAQSPSEPPLDEHDREIERHVRRTELYANPPATALQA